MKILNLYAGIGGNRKLWGDDHEVTAVENNEEVAAEYKKNFPKDTIIIGDAHEYLLEHFQEFDFIWSSPPCQTHSKMNRTIIGKTGKYRYPDMKLYQEILLLQEHFQGRWVVENVIPYYEVLIRPSKELDRHYFWSNFTIADLRTERKGLEDMNKAELERYHGFTIEKNIYLYGNHNPLQVLRNCVHPRLGLHVFECAFKEKQTTLPGGIQ